ncbi:MAG: hypothetical protein ACI4NA_01710 [Succinivibrio sp.]
MSYLVTSSNKDLSEYLQGLMGATGSSASSSASAASAELSDGRTFSADLSSVLMSQKDESDKSVKDKAQLVLNKVLYNGVRDDPDEKNSIGSDSANPKANSTLDGLKMLEQQGKVNQTEWQKAFDDNQQSDYSVLETIGSGLLSAAKLAGTVMAFL